MSGGTGDREAILGAVRASLGRGAGEGPARVVDARLAEPKPNLIPARGRLGGDALLELFVTMAEEVSATVARVATPGEVPGAVAGYLAANNLPAEGVLAPDPALDDVPWEKAPLLRLRRGRAEAADAVGVSGAFAGIAETGTLMLCSGPEHPSTINSLPDTHVVVLRREQIVGAYEEGWARLRSLGRGLPRTTIFVTGPSRTADIEQTIQLGAHGPRRLHIVLVDAPGHGGKTPQAR
jgi:L-lactate dehydrogenase complex protein LldG